MHVPKFEIEDVEDAYTYYVLILGISEDVFWGADISMLESIGADMNAYESWKNAEIGKMRE